MLHTLKKLLKAIVFAPVLLVLLFEEWGWEPLARAFAALGRHPVWARIEQFIARLPPWAALLAFGVPALALIPIKLLALYLLGRGHFAAGLFLVIAAKITGTAVAARLFQLTHPALMRMPWFARLYSPWKVWKDTMLDRVRASNFWQFAGRLKRRVKVLALANWERLKAF